MGILIIGQKEQPNYDFLWTKKLVLIKTAFLFDDKGFRLKISNTLSKALREGNSNGEDICKIARSELGEKCS